MALSSGPSVAEYQTLVESLRDIAKKDAQLVDDRLRLLDALIKLTERNEILLKEQKKLKKKHEEDQKLQSDIMAALEKQNDLLRQRVEDQEDEIGGLERRVAKLKTQISAATGITVRETRASADLSAEMTEQEKRKINQDLIVAASTGKLYNVQVLLANGASINHADQIGRTALMLAAAGGHLQIAEVLLANGANVNHTSDHGNSALIFAARGGHLPIVEVLLANGANVNHASEEGCTAIMEAASQGRNDMIKVLINKGANLGMKNNKEETALMVAENMRYNKTTELLRRAGARE